MPHVECVPLSEDLARDVASRLRAEDLLEIVGLGGEGARPAEHLAAGARLSSAGVIGLVDGVPAAAGGVIEHRPGVGMLWLLGTPDMDRVPLTMCKSVLAFVQASRSRWPRQWALSHQANETHHRWLRWMGFRDVRTALEGEADPAHVFKTFVLE